MIPSLDAHKSCRMRNTRSHIKLKLRNRSMLLLALIAMLTMSSVVRAQDTTSGDSADVSGGTSSGGTTQIKTSTSTTSPYAKGQLKIRIDAIEPEAGPISGKVFQVNKWFNR